MLIDFTLNGKPVAVDAPSDITVRDLLRDHLNMTGAKEGCNNGNCGACTVLMDGQPVNSCLVLGVESEGVKITTIEGIGTPDRLHPMQAAFRECHALQCGFCTPGMIMSAIDLLKVHPKPDEQTIRAELDGNLCRCTGYHNIVKAIKAVAAKA